VNSAQDVIDWDRHTIVGTSIKLEKPYLRLTSVRVLSDSPESRRQDSGQLPDPKTIRPLPVLAQTLDLLKRKWREEGNYAYICDQFKSMRQDLTVRCPARSVHIAADGWQTGSAHQERLYRDRLRDPRQDSARKGARCRAF
jgi:hypothetical protein